ncbi:MAG: right-handed parallel beta-helix repeat-containing protein [Candidatus Thorarchaeota archaeon]
MIKRASITITLVICMLLVVPLSISPRSQQANADVERSTIAPKTADMTLSINYTEHEPIEIDGNDDFITQGWPGNGTEANPFRISGLSIYSNTSSISISNVDAYFAISNSWLYTSSYPHYYGTFGIALNNASNGIIESCRTNNTSYGTHLNNSAGISIDSNLFGNSGRGVFVESSVFITVSNSTFMGSEPQSTGYSTGIVLLNSTQCLVSQNTIYGFEIRYGVRVEHGDSNKITGNRIREVSRGIEVHDETNLTVTYNEIIGAGDVGVFLRGSSSTLYGNLFYNYNGYPAVDWGNDSQWDDGNGIGNCWGLAEEDGPHEIEGGSVDRYPILADSIDIEYPIISSPADVNLTGYETEPEITWIAWSNPGTYEVYIDNVLSESGNWPGPGPFVLELDKSDSVNHTYTLVIYDPDGMNSSDSCDTILVPLPLSFIVQIAVAGTAGIVIIGLVVVDLRRRRIRIPGNSHTDFS